MAGGHTPGVYIRPWATHRVYIYIRPWLTPGVCMYMAGGHPGMHAYIYVYMAGGPPQVCVHIYMHNPPGEYMCKYISRSGSPGSPSEYIRSVMEQASRLHGSGCTSTPWREVTVMKIPRFSWFALHSLRGKPCHREGGWFRKSSERKIRRQEPGFCVHAGVQSSITHTCACICIHTYIYMQPRCGPQPRVDSRACVYVYAHYHAGLVSLRSPRIHVYIYTCIYVYSSLRRNVHHAGSSIYIISGIYITNVAPI